MKDVEANNLELYARVLVALETPEEAIATMQELCTHNEIRIIAQRAGIAELLMQDIPQKDIIGKLCHGDGTSGPSPATINRVREILENGDGHLCKMIARANGVEGS